MIFQRGHFNSMRVDESMVTRSLNESKNFKSSNFASSAKTVFLSHKHDDLIDLEGVMGLLRNLGAQIYIDSMDNKMPSQTTGETAIRIKEVIKFCRKFILLATDRAIESYWCNWELGIGDVHRYSNHFAILPIKEIGARDSQYNGNEYLQIYSSIDYEDGIGTYIDTKAPISKGYYVSTPVNREGVRSITPFLIWLSR